MSRRTNSLNAYEVSTTSSVGDASLTIPVETVTGLTVPLYLVIDPDDPTKREYFKVTAINGNNLEVGALANRGLLGTTGGLPLAHDNGATVRAVAVSQWLNDIFDDIEQLEAWDANHEVDADAHAQYVKVAGDAMEGFLSVYANPTSNLHAVPRQYLEAQLDARAPARETVVFAFPGTLEVKNGVGRFITQYDCTVKAEQAACDTAPTGSNATFRINIGAQTSTATVVAGNQDGAQVSDDESAPAGTVITVDITSVGSTNPGEDATVMVLLEAD